MHQQISTLLNGLIHRLIYYPRLESAGFLLAVQALLGQDSVVCWILIGCSQAAVSLQLFNSLFSPNLHHFLLAVEVESVGLTRSSSWERKWEVCPVYCYSSLIYRVWGFPFAVLLITKIIVKLMPDSTFSLHQLSFFFFFLLVKYIRFFCGNGWIFKTNFF